MKITLTTEHKTLSLTLGTTYDATSAANLAGSEAARDAALAAQGASETARDAAQTAQGASEAARAGAEQARDAAIDAQQVSVDRADEATVQAGIAIAKADESADSAALASQQAADAAAARDDAVAVAYNGEGSIDPAPGKIPVADADGLIRPGWIAASELNYVGIAYNVVTDTFQRLGASAGWPVGQFPGPQISPVFQALRRVALKDDGTVFKGISWLDFSQYEDGSAVDLTGGDGQIMVEYLPAYWRTDVQGDWIRVMISHLPLAGFALHPLFQGGVQAAYCGAYEGSVVAGSGQMSSIALDPADGVSPVYPATTRNETWGYAVSKGDPSDLDTAAGDTLPIFARGPGWQQWDYLTLHWQWVLMLVGFAGCNFQDMVGAGRTLLSGGSWSNGSYIGRCGRGDGVGGYYYSYVRGGSAGFGLDVSTVLGIEDFWGNVWTRTAALFSDNDVHYKPLPPYDYASTAGWTRLLDATGAGVTLPAVGGYGGVPFSGLGFGLPQDVTGTSSTRLSDYFDANTSGVGQCVPLVGGAAGSADAAGPFYVAANLLPAAVSALYGCRLGFKQT